MSTAQVPRWRDEGLAHVWLPYTQMKTAPPPLPVVGAMGARLTLQGGTELVDGISSWWTACHGYRHPHIEAAVKAQLETLPHVMLGGLAHEPAYRLATRLAALCPGDLERVFFSESGSVAVEVALKIALQYWQQRGEAGRTRFVSFLGGYHGDTFAAMSVCDPVEGMHQRFSASLSRHQVVPLPQDEATLEGLRRELEERAGEVAAVVLEPLVQGAGGMRFHPPEILRGIREACDAAGVLLILDEIATGFLRTGTLFACEQAGVVPDLLCLSKALTGGTLPLAATVARAPVFEAFWSDRAEDALMHGPTFMGNPLACAAAHASLDLFEREPRRAQVASIERRLQTGLQPCRDLPGVRDVRVQGAVGVVQLDESAVPLRDAFVERGVWVRPLLDVVYLMPPFVIEPADLETLVEAVVEVVTAWSAAR